MENKGLVFIPDISGFTRFVSETEIDHSRRIIEELLEVLIKANELGLEISEIEGDAILFYKYGKPPALPALYRQVERMFRTFHESINVYDQVKYCQCKACVGVVNLSLKIVTHYGEFTDYNVRNFRKLIGKDIIVAHQLLKNDIPQHEYWLVTPDLAGDRHVLREDWMKWNSSVKQTEAGDIPFFYMQLTPLKETITAAAVGDVRPQNKTKVLSVSDTYDTDIITLFHATGDFQYRTRWMDGVLKVEELDHFLPRIGMRCRYTTHNGTVTVFSSSYNYTPERVAFSETDGRDNTTSYTLEKTGHDTRLTIDVYRPAGAIANALFSIFRKRHVKASLLRSLSALHRLIKEIHIPTADVR